MWQNHTPKYAGHIMVLIMLILVPEHLKYLINVKYFNRNS